MIGMITADELRQVKIFSSLDETELIRLAQKAADVRLAPGEWLIREGELPWFFVLFEGRLQMVKDILGRQQDIHEFQYEVGDFFGEVPILLGTHAFVSLRAETPCRVARFDRQELHNLIRDSKEISAMILQAMNERLMRAQKFASMIPSCRVLILGTEYDTDCREIRSFLSVNRIPYEWVDREREPERIPSCVSKDMLGPTVVIDGQHCLHPPTVRGVAESLQIQTQPKGDKYDVVIAGAGPAGMAAGVYGASEGLTVLMVERSAAGGQAGTSSRIENYLGFPEGISGDDLTGRALKQAFRFGAEIAMTRSIEALKQTDGGYSIELDGGQCVLARTVLLATGVDWRRLEVAGVDRLLGRGVLYGASRTDAIHVNGKKVFIVGGGNSAGQAAVFFSNYAAEIKILVRGEGLKVSMSQYLIGEIAAKTNVHVVPFTQVIAAEGGDHLERIVTSTRLKDGKDSLCTHEADALFVMIGADANTSWLPRDLERDDKGYILTGRYLTTWKLGREPFPLETSLPGVFCAGDVRHDSIKRVSSAVGEGSMAIAFIHQYLALRENGERALVAR
ncbi:MAG TPA: FAD-dependent oxidoreductase [Acidobacteriaceae bacterium]|jgi:thioredoxin reductase (NADPH)